MKACIKCGQSRSDEINFCYRDGTEMTPYPFCKCGYNMNPKFDAFCEKCGAANPLFSKLPKP